MMIYPKIDELETKMGNKYRLACVMSKRAKELEKRIPEVIEKGEKKAITLAAEEIAKGEVIAND